MTSEIEQRIAALEAKVEELISQQREHLESIAEDNYSVEKFMSKQFPTMKRIPLKDVCSEYKKLYGIRMSQSCMIVQLELLGFRITTASGKRFVNRALWRIDDATLN